MFESKVVFFFYAVYGCQRRGFCDKITSVEICIPFFGWVTA